MAGPINFAVWQTQQAGSTVTETNNVSVSEGADIETTNLSGISLSATVATGITFTSWTCTGFPGVGDLEFPNGTTASAVEAGLSNPTSSATNLTVPGPGRYEFTATWSDSTTETMSVRVVRPLPLAALTVTHGEVVTGGSAISETLSDTNGADITAPGAFSGGLVEYPSGSTVSLSHDGNGGYTGTNPSAASNGLTLIWTATVTDNYGRISKINKAQHMAGTGGSAVTPPNPTTASAAFDGSLSDKTFGSFTDPDARIATYFPSNVGTSGSPTWSGTGLGPYTATVGNGEGGVLLLSALDGSGNTLATAAHAYSIAAEGPKDVVVAPADTNEHVTSGTEFTAKTFGAFTDNDSRIDNYIVDNLQTNGSTTWSGTAPGPFTASSAAGDSGVFLLHARDASNNVLATAVHAYSRAAVGVGTVVAPAETSEDVDFGQSLSDHTFGAFTDPNNIINNYVKEIVNISGAVGFGGSGLGPYSPSSMNNGDNGVLLLHARNASNAIVATAVHGYSIGVPQEGSVQPPAPSSQSVGVGSAFSTHTFSAFTDPGNLITSYREFEQNSVGSTTWNGTGLGPYTASGSVDGDAGTLYVEARNSGGDVLAIAIHSYSREELTGDAVVVAPGSTSQHTDTGVNLTAKTFGSFTDADSRIDNYLKEEVVSEGSSTWSGSGLGPYTCTSADGDSGVLLLHARDAVNNILATAVHVFSRGVPNPSGATITISGRDDGDTYNITSGARSLSITNNDSGTLSTAVEKASDGTPITVTNPTTTTPSWTVPSSTDAEAYQVVVTVTKDGIVNTHTFTEYDPGTGGGVTGLSLPTDVFTLNLLNESNTAIADTSTSSFTLSSLSCSGTGAGATTFEIQNGTGLVCEIDNVSSTTSQSKQGSCFYVNIDNSHAANAIFILDWKVSNVDLHSANDHILIGTWNNFTADGPGGEMQFRGDGTISVTQRSGTSAAGSAVASNSPWTVPTTFYVRQIFETISGACHHYFGSTEPDSSTTNTLSGGLDFAGVTRSTVSRSANGTGLQAQTSNSKFAFVRFARDGANASTMTVNLDYVKMTELTW